MTKTPYLDGQLLIAMPSMSDRRFERSVIYLCAHSEQGAMGLIINKTTPMMRFGDLIGQLVSPCPQSVFVPAMAENVC